MCLQLFFFAMVSITLQSNAYYLYYISNSNQFILNSLLDTVVAINSKGNHVIAFGLYAAGHNQCQKKQEGTYLMDVGDFSKAYVAQQYTNYYLMGNDFDVPEAIAYAECTAVYYNDVQVSFCCCRGSNILILCA